MTITNQSIILSGLRFYAYHGVEPQERIVGAWYTVDLEMWADLSAAMESDCIDDTINYAKAAQIVQQEMAKPSALLEHVAARIADTLMKAFPTLQSLQITLSKEHPPIAAECSSATVRLTFSKHSPGMAQ